MIWKIIDTNSKLFNKFYNYMNASNYILLEINKLNKYKENDCHNNVNIFLKKNNSRYSKILGYYVLESYDKSEILAIQHSVIIDLKSNNIFDITPCSFFEKKLFIYGYKMKEYASIQYIDNDKIKTIKTTVDNIDGYFL
jgi:hypothetical protein